VAQVFRVQGAAGLELGWRGRLREGERGLEWDRRDRFAHAPQYRRRTEC